MKILKNQSHKLFAILFIILAFTGCTKDSSPDNSSKLLLEELQDSPSWFVDNRSVELNTIEEYIVFKKSSEQEFTENYYLWGDESCYLRVNSSKETWAITKNTETEFFIHNSGHETGDLMFRRIGDEIIVSWEEYENGELMTPVYPPLAMTKSNISPINDLTICN